jgi:hypothetical protein
MKISLKQPNLRNVEVGTVVETSKGFEFELMERKFGDKEAWKDLTSGVTWYDVEDGKYNHHDALKRFKDELPTKEEFEEAEKHGFREVLQNIKDRWFWSSSVHPDYSDVAFVFVGSSGGVGIYYRDSLNGSARCVGR